MGIQVLDQHTAELIAAGEVVERPASVVKELVENAIDAGAKHISVQIEQGGVSLIRVEDDGEGIPADEIPVAFLRHATSKVRSQKDLDSILTLGFRGEALASIASVAQVELLTKTDEQDDAVLYRISGGQEQGSEPAARSRGTTISVKNLFYNTPARMKFLKKDASEATVVGETVTRLALSNPGVSVRFIRDGKEIFATPGDGQLRSAAYMVLGASFARELIETQCEQHPYKIEGLVTPPRCARPSRSMQYFFMNGRFVKNGTMMAALEQAYRGTTMQGRFPGGILFVEMPPQLVDVNVHPAKTEVRFAEEKQVFGSVYRAVKQALSEDTSSGRLSFAAAGQTPPEQQEPKPAVPAVSPIEKEKTAEIPASLTPDQTEKNSRNEQVKPPVQRTLSSFHTMQATPLSSDSSFIPYNNRRESGLDISPEDDGPAQVETKPSQEICRQDRVANAATDQPEIPDEKTTQAAPKEDSFPGFSEAKTEQVAFIEQKESLRFVGEVFKTYILAEKGDTLCVIDKHAAHERLLYEKLIAERVAPGIQQLLAPVPLKMGAAEKNALLENEDALASAGFEIEDFGGADVLIRGIPADVQQDSVTDLVTEVANQLMQSPGETLDSKTQWILHSIACRAAIKAGDKTSPQQLLSLAQDILDNKIPPYCPHGRPVVLEITQKELEKQFGRLG